MPVSTEQCVFVKRYFRRQSCEAVKHAYQVHFPVSDVRNESTNFRLLIDECVETC
jgi:hypothetical protein